MIRLLLVDDHAVVRAGIKQILVDHPDILVVGEASTAAEALAAVAATSYDLVVLDLSLPDQSGFELLKQLHATHPTLPALVFSVHPERQYAVQAFKCGASGYLPKRSVPQELVLAVDRIVKGEPYIGQTVAQHLFDDLTPSTAPPHTSLSERETEVLHKLAAGQSIKEIAYELGLSVKTVSTYRTRLLTKLDLESTADLIRYALRYELID